MFIVFNLLLANQYQFDGHLLAQLGIVLVFIFGNMIYLLLRYVAKLPKIYQIRMVKTKGKTEECPICLESIDEKEGAETGCGHFFHA